MALCSAAGAQPSSLSPFNGGSGVNPDTHLTVTFDHEPVLTGKGRISVYDKQTGRLVDRLDMSVPAGPTEPQARDPRATYTPVPYVYKANTGITNRNTRPGTPSGAALRDRSNYQRNIIGGFSDAFHFYPVIVHGNTATIYLHNNMLDYGREYYVTIDRGVFAGEGAIGGKSRWTFTTKATPPGVDCRTLTVAADGTGDFSTLQGALDFIPDSIESEAGRYTVKVADGDYEELVYTRNKRFVTIAGESRGGVVVHYPNNEVFNPHPSDIKTNEVRGTFPSRRAAVAFDNCSDMVIRDITFRTDCKGQAEGLLINGERNVCENVHVIGDGDALQANGPTLFSGCRIDGGGDTVLGRGPCYFYNCTLSSFGAFMWIRNGRENHGNVFNSCRFIGKSEGAVIARLPDNKGRNYPYAECVLIGCVLDGVPPAGWGTIASGGTEHVNFAAYGCTDARGNAIDTSEWNPRVEVWTLPADWNSVSDYMSPSFVLGM